jgi:hypothetical protein
MPYASPLLSPFGMDNNRARQPIIFIVCKLSRNNNIALNYDGFIVATLGWKTSSLYFKWGIP